MDALTWLDGSALKYTNWRLKAPDASVMNVDTCVSMRVSDAAWLLASCTDRLGYVCKSRSGANTFSRHQTSASAFECLVAIINLLGGFTYTVLTFVNDWPCFIGVHNLDLISDSDGKLGVFFFIDFECKHSASASRVILCQVHKHYEISDC